MSNATVSNGIRRQSERKAIGESTQAESAAPSVPEQTTNTDAVSIASAIETADPELVAEIGIAARNAAESMPQGVDKARLLAAYEQSFDRSVKSVGAILDNTALSVYCQVVPTATIRSIGRRTCSMPKSGNGSARKPSPMVPNGL